MRHPLAETVLALRGQKSFGLIAKDLGVSRNVVAGIVFRTVHPKTKSIGTGYRRGVPAKECLAHGKPPGRVRTRGCRAALGDIAEHCRKGDIDPTLILEIAERAISRADHNAAYSRERKSSGLEASS